MPFQLNNNFLLIGIGNTGRQDDGLGWAVVDRLKAMGFSGVCEYRMQLNVEDAELISHYEKVLLIDASELELPDGYSLKEVVPGASFTYTSHSLTPATVAYLCRAVLGKTPQIHLLQIQGHNWEIGEGLSPSADKNMTAALQHIRMSGN